MVGLFTGSQAATVALLVSRKFTVNAATNAKSNLASAVLFAMRDSTRDHNQQFTGINIVRCERADTMNRRRAHHKAAIKPHRDWFGLVIHKLTPATSLLVSFKYSLPVVVLGLLVNCV